MFRSSFFNRHIVSTILNLLVLIVCCASFSSVHAAAIGLPEFTAKFGIGTKITHVSVNDPNGHTNKVTSPQSTSVYLTDWFTKGTRYLAEAYLASYAFNAEGQKRVGELVDQTGVRFSLQTNTIMNKYFAPWFGIGLDMSYSHFKKRHVVDDDGYLLAHYEDKSKPSLGLLFNAMEKWSINSSFDIAAKLEYSAPITQTVNGLSASVIFLFRPMP